MHPLAWFKLMHWLEIMSTLYTREHKLRASGGLPRAVTQTGSLALIKLKNKMISPKVVLDGIKKSASNVKSLGF
jgi:hypothetical protein